MNDHSRIRDDRACEEWIDTKSSNDNIIESGAVSTVDGRDKNGHRVSIKVYKDADHAGILTDSSLIAEVIKLATVKEKN